MAQFRVRLLIQCGQPGVTPAVETRSVNLPNRMLWELPRQLAPLLAAGGNFEIPTNGPEPQLARQAALSLLGTTTDFDLLPEVWTHREVAGSYLRTQEGSYVFVLSRKGATNAYATRQSIAMTGDDGVTQLTTIEFRCHVIAERLDEAGKAEAADAAVSES
ncbi:MAG: hypothetical protein IPK26_10155 [Planctomycetes bacterium]|nr:hypothetical protein [Planctomycetota bacterium]